MGISKLQGLWVTCNPHKFEIPALWFPRRVPVNPCKHLQCSHSIQVSIFQNVVHPVGLFNPVGFVNPVGLVNVNNCKLSRSTNLALNFPKILNLYNIFQTPSHTCLQVLFCLLWYNVIFFWISHYGYMS